jgi:hypothetical protein
MDRKNHVIPSGFIFATAFFYNRFIPSGLFRHCEEGAFPDEAISIPVSEIASGLHLHWRAGASVAPRNTCT